MQDMILCLGCQRLKPANPRATNQKYCGDKECRAARKREWYKRKMKEDPEFRKHQKENQTDWREAHPGYQSDYRKNNPDYVAKNCEQQTEHNAKRPRRRAANTPILLETIVKLDASDSTKTEGYGEKAASPLEIVKLDASTHRKTNLCLELETPDQIVRIEAIIAQANVSFRPKASSARPVK